MKAVIRSIYSTDVDVETYRSMDSSDDGQWIRLLIGPTNGLGEESFDVLVCTAQWLSRGIERDGMKLIRHTLVMDAFDLRRAVARLHHEVSLVSGDTWQDMLPDLVQIGRWEFEGYQTQ